MAAPVQIPCRKQGIYKQGNWSARILTVDTATGTVAVSRKNRPNVVYYHAMQVKKVQMWPHFSREHIVGNFNSLRKSQLVLRLVGVETPASGMRPAAPGNAAAIVQQHRSAFAPQPATHNEESSSDAEELPASPSRDAGMMSSPTTKQGKGRQVYWMLRFETLLNYEAAVLALLSMKRPDGQPLKLFTSSNVQGDFNRIKRAYEINQGIAPDVTKMPAPAPARAVN
ncbi:hypothetical protein N2W54_002119 [Lotmaria passim]